MIIKGASGAEAELPINLFDLSGNPVTGHVWVTGEVKIALPGAALTDADVANIRELGQGRYRLQLTALETATVGFIQLHLMNGVTWLPHSFENVILDLGGVTRDALLNYAFRSGRTVRGFFRRLDALATNKATGLRGALATFFQPGGVLAEYTAAQDTTAGTRTEASVTNSETP